jgi:hypothetical protein
MRSRQPSERSRADGRAGRRAGRPRRPQGAGFRPGVIGFGPGKATSPPRFGELRADRGRERPSADPRINWISLIPRCARFSTTIRKRSPRSHGGIQSSRRFCRIARHWCCRSLASRCMPKSQNFQSAGRLDEAVVEIVVNAREVQAAHAGPREVHSRLRNSPRSCVSEMVSPRSHCAIESKSMRSVSGSAPKISSPSRAMTVTDAPSGRSRSSSTRPSTTFLWWKGSMTVRKHVQFETAWRA